MPEAEQKNAIADCYSVGRHIKVVLPYPEHCQTHAEIFWIEAGNGFHKINGIRESLQPGTLVMMRKGDRHTFGALAGETILLSVVILPTEILEELEKRYFIDRKLFFWTRDILPYRENVDASTSRLLDEWADELARAPNHPFYLDHFLMNIFAHLSMRPAQISMQGAPGWFVRACEQAPNQLAGGVRGFFKSCGRSREHVTRTMKRYLHTTPTNYIAKLRMTYARRHLEMGNQEILEIALDCGMENLSHFYTLFRRETGSTPRAYRLRHQMTAQPAVRNSKGR